MKKILLLTLASSIACATLLSGDFTNSTTKRKVNYSNVTHSSWGYKEFKTNKTINVKNLSTDSIQNAINEASTNGGGVVNLPKGTILVSDKITLKDNVKLIGSLDDNNLPATKFIPKNGYKGIVFRCDGWKNGVIKNIEFDSHSQDVRPLECWGGGNQNILIKNNIFKNVGLAQIEVKNVDANIRAQNRGVINAVNFYMDMDQDRNSHITVEDNYFDSIAEHPIDFRKSDYIIINNNIVTDAMDGVDVSSANRFVEVLNNDFSNTAEGVKIVGNGARDIFYHNNATYNNPKSSYWDSGHKEDGGGSGMFIQYSVENLNIYDNLIDGDRMSIKTDAGGLQSANLKNNKSKNAKIEDQNPQNIKNASKNNPFTNITQKQKQPPLKQKPTIKPIAENSNAIHGAKLDNSGSGEFYKWDDADAIRGLVFNANKEFLLKSVKVYNQKNQADTRVFSLYDNQNNIIDSVSVYVVEGESRVVLNMVIPKGDGYKLMADIHKGLYKNNNITGYPYQVGDVATIVSSDVGKKYYYFFYDWEVEVDGDLNFHPKPKQKPRPKLKVLKTKAFIPNLDFSKNDVYGNGNVITVKNSKELENVLSNAPSHTTIILEKGTYKNLNINIPKGTNFITIKGKNGATLIPSGDNGNSAFVFLGANSPEDAVHDINFINLEIKGDGGRKQFIHSGDDSTYSVYNVYLKNLDLHGLKMGIYSGLHSHDWTLDNSKLHDSTISHMWYMMGWHQAVINSTFYNGSHDQLAIRGYYPDGEKFTYIGDENDDSCHGNIYTKSRKNRSGFLAKNDWTHLIKNNKFLAWKRADNQRYKENSHIAIAYGLYADDPKCGAERVYLPPQNIEISNNTFTNKGEENSLKTDAILVNAWGDLESNNLASINGTKIIDNSFTKSQDSEKLIVFGDNSGGIRPDISKIQTSNNTIK